MRRWTGAQCEDGHELAVSGGRGRGDGGRGGPGAGVAAAGGARGRPHTHTDTALDRLGDASGPTTQELARAHNFFYTPFFHIDNGQKGR